MAPAQRSAWDMMRNFNGFGQDPVPTPTQDQAQILYDYMKAGQTAAVSGQLASLDATTKQTVCNGMAALAQQDTDTTMLGKITSVCTTAGAAPSTSHTGTYMLVGAAALIGLIYIASRHKK